MRRIYVDLAGLEEPGTYDVEIAWAEYYERRLSRKGALASGIEWALTVLDGEHAGETIYMDTPLRDDLLWLLHRVFVGFGISTTRQTNLELDDSGG